MWDGGTLHGWFCWNKWLPNPYSPKTKTHNGNKSNNLLNYMSCINLHCSPVQFKQWGFVQLNMFSSAPHGGNTCQIHRFCAIDTVTYLIIAINRIFGARASYVNQYFLVSELQTTLFSTVTHSIEVYWKLIYLHYDSVFKYVYVLCHLGTHFWINK